ncbi:MAG: Tex family protein [Polyangiaceae bacterium]
MTMSQDSSTSPVASATTTSSAAAPNKLDLSKFDPTALIVSELNLPVGGVSAVVRLLEEGATVPFIARYRKEATGGLDEVQIRAVEEQRTYFIELEERRRTVLSEIEKQGKLTDSLKAKITSTRSKSELEDLYLPYKPKRRTRAIIARERGLEPLADRMWAQPADGSPEAEAAAFVDAKKEVPDVAAALAGARDICAERIAEDAATRKLVRDAYFSEGTVKVEKEKEHADKVTKFDTYASFEEPLKSIPSHRFLAIRRGEAEGVLRASLELDAEKVVPGVMKAAHVNKSSPWGEELSKAVTDAYKRLLVPSVQSDVRIELKLQADRGAVDVFAQNLRQLLLAAPFGTRTVIGIDPGQRTGCKTAVVDDTGKLLEHTLLQLVQGDGALEKSKKLLLDLCKKYHPAAVAVGNGTHGRETEAFVREVLATVPELKTIICVPVSEAGASVYSASEVARDEFPDLDLTVRGAISIARRLQDPLAELVKVDPKSIGVGQYQHDVHQPMLGKKLDEVVESCVNAVGVELNTASAPLLSRVSGLTASIAKKIVAHRNERGAFRSRKTLLEVPGVGPRTFEQAAGFLRIRGGEHPLDSSAVHPERYALVEKIASDLGVPVVSLIGNNALIDRIDLRKYMSGDVGEFTLKDIVSELKKPGRDPRETFEPPKFRDDVRTMEDLRVGMVLEGVITNVTAFGAFVDIGVHQDGLVHVSKLADRFIKDPAEVAKVGDKVRVRVMEVDLQRKRISLSARKDDLTEGASGKPDNGTSTRMADRRDSGRDGGRDGGRGSRDQQRGARPQATAQGFSNNPFAKLLGK